MYRNSRVSNLLSRFEKETTKIEQHWLDVAVEMLCWKNEFTVDNLVVNGTSFNEDILRLPDHVFSDWRRAGKRKGGGIYGKQVQLNQLRPLPAAPTNQHPQSLSNEEMLRWTNEFTVDHNYQSTFEDDYYHITHNRPTTRAPQRPPTYESSSYNYFDANYHY